MKLQLRLSVLVVIVCSSFITGCSQTASLLNFNKIPMASAKDPVFEILGIWEPSDGQGPDGKSRRGCAGQVMFMTRGRKSPVQVNGEVTVYQFDDFGSAEEQAKPIHTFRFDGAAWNRHFGEGALGPSYSVFIPYMRDTTLETVCALRIKFKSDDGREISSSVAKINIPGIDRNKKSSVATAAAAVAAEKDSQKIVTQVPKRKMGQHLANVDRGRLRPVDTEQAPRNNSVQQANYEETDSTTDDARVDAYAARKIAELEAKLATMKKRKPSDKKSVLMNRNRFQSAPQPTSRYRKAGSYGPPSTESD